MLEPKLLLYKGRPKTGFNGKHHEPDLNCLFVCVVLCVMLIHILCCHYICCAEFVSYI